MDESQKITLTIIVPCYNVEKFLDRSLGCLERQWRERSDYEIILVNDASCDSTAVILHEFQQRHPGRVAVIDKETNEGVASARNSGLEAARGEWIAFFDPDDALIDSAYSRLIDVAQANADRIDVLSFGVSIINEGEWNDYLTHDNNSAIAINTVSNGNQCVIEGISGVCWRYLFKRDLLRNRRFRDLTLLEDFLFVLPIFLSDIKVGHIDSKVYFYIQRPSSATNMLDSKKMNRGCDDMLTVIQEIEKLKVGQSLEVQNALDGRQTFYAMNMITRLFLSDKNYLELKHIAQVLKDLSILPLNNGGIKMTMRNLVLNHVWIIQLVRPLYRTFRIFKNSY